MKLMRLAMVAAFAVAGGIAIAEDYVDIGAMQAKLAAQEARLNDLQAKIYGDACGEKEKVIADGLTSLRKNAVVTIGGTVNQRWYSMHGDVESSLVTDRYYGSTWSKENSADWLPNPASARDGSYYPKGSGDNGALSPSDPTATPMNPSPAPGSLKPGTNRFYGTLQDSGNMTRRAEWNYQKFWTSDAKLEVKIDVNDFFDAYLKMNLAGDYYGSAENYWVRWKNVCNSGFGILVGRDGMAYGSGFGVGGAGADNWNLNNGAGSDIPGLTAAFLDTFTEDTSFWGTNPPGFTEFSNPGLNGFAGSAEAAMFVNGRIIPAHNYWDFGNTLQIKPYWEGANGRVKLEASIFSEANINASGCDDLNYNADGSYRDGYWYGRSNNFGVASFAARATVVPVDGLTLSVSYLNMGQRNNWDNNGFWGFDGNGGRGAWNPTAWKTTSRSQGIQAGIQYIPVCFNRLKVFANYGHGWDDFFIDDYKSDTWAFGASFGITDQLTWYGYGDLLYVTNNQANQFYKANGWAVTTGLQYTLPYGINAEAGYRHESVKYENRAGANHTKYKGDVVYAHLGFNF